MYEVIANWLDVIVLLLIVLISLQITINSPKNVVIKLINALISVIIIVTVIFVAQNKFIVEREATLKAELEFEKNDNDSSDLKEMEAIEEAKAEEESNMVTLAVYKKEKKYVLEKISFTIQKMKEIESLHEDRYNTVTSDDYLFDKYRLKSSDTYSTIKRINKDLRTHTFKSKLSASKPAIKRAFASAEKASGVYYKVFYKEQDVSYPHLVKAARNAKYSLLELKNSLR